MALLQKLCWRWSQNVSGGVPGDHQQPACTAVDTMLNLFITKCVCE